MSDETKPVPASRQTYLRDVVYGALDGAVTTFAIVAGVEGAGLSRGVIIALGIANVLADGFSMAAGDYSGTKAERDDSNRLRSLESERIGRDPDGARADLRRILAAKGLSGATLDDAVAAVSERQDTWVAVLMSDLHGVSNVDARPSRAAAATFLAFVAAGAVPLMPFLLDFDAPFLASIAMTMATFAAIGALKSRWSLTPWWRSAAETLAIGGAAAMIAFFVGRLFDV